MAAPKFDTLWAVGSSPVRTRSQDLLSVDKSRRVKYGLPVNVYDEEFLETERGAPVKAMAGQELVDLEMEVDELQK